MNDIPLQNPDNINMADLARQVILLVTLEAP